MDVKKEKHLRLREQVRKIEEKILAITGKNVEFNMEWTHSQRKCEQVERLIWKRKHLLNKMFVATPEEVSRMEQVNNQLFDLTQKMYARTEALYRKMATTTYADGGEVNIYGGNYTNDLASDLIYAKNGGVVNIYGGTFKASNYNKENENGTAEEYSALNLHDKQPGTITVYGGSFYKFNPADNKSENPKVSFVAAGYKSVQNGDWWVVSAE